MKKIHNKIYLGDASDGREPDQKVDVTLNVSRKLYDSTDYWYPLKDRHNDQVHFDAVMYNVLKHMENSKTKLIHCSSGLSRSVVVCAFILNELDGEKFQTIKESVEFVKNKANLQLDPEPGLIRNLEQSSFL